MAVKSAEVSNSCSIQKEREILSNIKGSPNIIHCFGEETTISSSGSLVYNLLLEYASAGTLAHRITSSLPESEVRFFTRSILRGLHHIHSIGYVHCDLKPDNILLMMMTSSNNGGNSQFRVRATIGDFGLAKRVVMNMKQGRKRRKLDDGYWRGTPMYLSPEAVIESIQEPPSDIWALGCIVLEMLTGKPPWEEEEGDEILAKIGKGVMPKIPEGLSLLAKDFLKGCFVRNPRFRLTAEMLLSKAFVEGLGVEEMEDNVVVEDLDEEESILIVSDEEESEWSYDDEDLAEEGGWSSEEEENLSSISEERELLKEGDDEEEEDKVVSRHRYDDGFSIGVRAGV